jgi:hypothetical protein
VQGLIDAFHENLPDFAVSVGIIDTGVETSAQWHYSKEKLVTIIAARTVSWER